MFSHCSNSFSSFSLQAISVLGVTIATHQDCSVLKMEGDSVWSVESCGVNKESFSWLCTTTASANSEEFVVIKSAF